ncbi:MAG: hypothetical protein AAF483_03430 [Planctomycetota bacterium]
MNGLNHTPILSPLYHQTKQIFFVGLVLLGAVIVPNVKVAAQTNVGRDYGWFIDEKRDNALVFVVQMTPEQAQVVQLNSDPRQASQQKVEFSSEMPPELVGRVTRIVVRIGTDILPRTPSLAEIKLMPRFMSSSDVTASLGPGRIAEIDGGSVVNVQNSNLPSMPSAPNTNPNQRFLAGTTGSGSSTSLPFPSTSPSTSSNLPNVNSKFENTAAGAPSMPNNNFSSRTGAQGWNGSTSPSPGTMGNTGSLSDLPNSYGNTGNTLNTSRTPTPNFGSTPGAYASAQQPGTYGQSQPYGGTTSASNTSTATNPNAIPNSIGNGQVGYASNAPQQNQNRSDIADNQGRNGAGNRSGYGGGGYGGRGYGGRGYGGDGYGRGGNSRRNNGYGGGGYGGNGYGGGGYGAGRMAGVPALTRLLSNNLAANNLAASGLLNNALQPAYGPLQNAYLNYPALQSPSLLNPVSNSTARKDAEEDDEDDSDKKEDLVASASDVPVDGNSDTSSEAGSVLVKLFFLVSLVANCYLIFLIRKLLMRYRSLLSTVRSHAIG